MARLMWRLGAVIAALLLAWPAHAQTGSTKTRGALTTEINTNFQDNTTGAITPFLLRQTTLDMMTSSQSFGCVNAQTGTSYVVLVTDFGCLLTFSNTNPVAVTLPQANGTFSPFNVFIVNKGAGTVTITPTVSTINGAATLVLTTGQGAWIVSDGANYQIFEGAGGAASGVTSVTTDNSINANPSAGAVVLSLATAHANSWTTTQTFAAPVVMSALGGGTQTSCLGLTSGNNVVTSGSGCGSASSSIAAGTNITTSGTASNVTINVVSTPTFTSLTATNSAITGFLTAVGTSLNTLTVAQNLTSTSAQFLSAVTLTGLPSGTQTTCLGLTAGFSIVTSTGGCGQSTNTNIAAGTNITTSGSTNNVTVNVVATPTFTSLTSTNGAFTGFLTATGTSLNSATIAGALIGSTANFSSNLTGTTGNFSGNLTSATHQVTGLLTGSTAIFAGNLTASSSAQFTSAVTLTGLPSGTQTTCLGLSAGLSIVTSTGACGSGTSTSIAAGQNITTSGTASNVTVNATPTGPANAVQFVSATNGQFGGDSGFTYAGNSSGIVTHTLGTVTTSNSRALNIIGTWNASTVAFDAPLFMNITNTAAATGSLIMDLQVSGTSTLAATGFPNAQLLVGNGTSPSGLLVYNTMTGGTIGNPTNFERAVIDWTTSSNILTIGTQKGGTGTARNIQFEVGNSIVLDYGVTTPTIWTAPGQVTLGSLNFTSNQSTTQFYSGGNVAQIWFRASGSDNIRWLLGQQDMAANIALTWQNGNNSLGGSDDTGIKRNTAGLVEINNGSGGTFRDLIARTYNVGAADTFLNRAAAGFLQFGATDAAAPVTQTMGPQSVIAGTTDTIGVDWNIVASRGTGAATGGRIIFKTAPAGATGTAQNTATREMAITVTSVDFSGALNAPSIAQLAANTTGYACWTTGTGAITEDSTTCLSSLRSLKKDIIPFTTATEELVALKPSEFQWKDPVDTNQRGPQLGFIAEDVHNVDPRLASYTGDGNLHGWRQDAMIAVLVRGFQEQQATIQRQQAEIDDLKARLH